jgi:hypothetical protein
MEVEQWLFFDWVDGNRGDGTIGGGKQGTLSIPARAAPALAAGNEQAVPLAIITANLTAQSFLQQGFMDEGANHRFSSCFVERQSKPMMLFMGLP